MPESACWADCSAEIGQSGMGTDLEWERNKNRNGQKSVSVPSIGAPRTARTGLEIIFVGHVQLI